MIIWRGLGFLAVLLPFLGLLLPSILGQNSQIYASAGMIIGSIISGIIGIKIDNGAMQMSAQRKGKNISTTIYKHELFWINMKYWTLPFVLLSLITLVDILINGAYTQVSNMSSQLILAATAMYALWNRHKQNKTKKWMKLAQSSDQATGTMTIKENNSLKKYSVKTQKKTSSSESAAPLSTEQQKKKEFNDQLKSESGKLKQFEKSDHSKYLPE